MRLNNNETHLLRSNLGGCGRDSFLISKTNENTTGSNNCFPLQKLDEEVIADSVGLNRIEM